MLPIRPLDSTASRRMGLRSLTSLPENRLWLVTVRTVTSFRVHRHSADVLLGGVGLGIISTRGS